MTARTHTQKIPAVFCWSGGKDSAYALYKVLEEDVYDVRYLLSTFSGVYKRLSMHGVREALIEKQAIQIGLPLIKVVVQEASNAAYEREMNEALIALQQEGIHTILFGDIFLADLRAYREETMAAINIRCVFPIWELNTRWLVEDFVAKGFQSVVCCINDGYLTEAWLGKLINEDFIKSLPPIVDPCGENGEFHSFCFDGPLFKNPVAFTIGEKTYKPLLVTTTDHPTAISDAGTKGFWFCDLLTD